MVQKFLSMEYPVDTPAPISPSLYFVELQILIKFLCYICTGNNLWLKKAQLWLSFTTDSSARNHLSRVVQCHIIRYWLHLKWVMTRRSCVCMFYRGQTPADAEFSYLETAKRLDMYGVDLHSARVRVRMTLLSLRRSQLCRLHLYNNIHTHIHVHIYICCHTPTVHLLQQKQQQQ